MRTLLVLVVALLLLAGMWVVLIGTVDEPPAKTTTAAVFPTPTSTTTTSSPPSTTSSTSMPRAHETAPTRQLVSSTAYCETGLMANGKPAHDGAVSSYMLRRGSRWRITTGPNTGLVLIVEDTGSLAIFDIAMPGRCDDARAYGRQTIEIEEAA